METTRTPTPSPRRPDLLLVVTLLAVLAFGLVMVNSASSVTSYQAHGTPTYYFVRQVIWAALGLVGMLVLMRCDYHLLGRLAIPAHAVAIVLLALVLLPGVGHSVHGAQRWIALPGFQVQPSELIKLTMALYISRWLANKGTQVTDLAYGFLPFLTLLGLVFGLIMLQPDMGTAMVVGTGAVSVFFAAGASVSQLGLFFGASSVAAILLI